MLRRTSPSPIPSMVTVTFAWDADPPQYNVTDYRLYYGYSSGVYTYSVDAFTNATISVTLSTGATYYFAVMAINSAGEQSPYSNEVQVNE